MGHPLPIATALALALLLTAELGSCVEEMPPPQLMTSREVDSPGTETSATSDDTLTTLSTAGSDTSMKTASHSHQTTTSSGSSTTQTPITTSSFEDTSSNPLTSKHSSTPWSSEVTTTMTQLTIETEDTSPTASTPKTPDAPTTENTSPDPSPSSHSVTPRISENTVTTNQGSTTPEDMSTTPSGSGSSASSSLPEATVTTRWTSSETEDTSPTSSPSNLTSTEMTEETSKSPTTTPQAAPVGIALSFRITNRNFTKELENPDSEEFKKLSKTIEDVYQAIYNCSTCPDRDDFLGSRVISFSKGSVVVASELFFRHPDNTSSSEFASRVEDSLTNANKSILQNLNMTDVKAEVSTPTPPTMGPPTGTKDTSLTHSPSGLTTTPKPSEGTPTPTQLSETSPTSSLATTEQFTTTENASMTSSPPGPNSTETTEEPPKIPTPAPEPATVWISLGFRITNRNFTDELSNPDSEEFKKLSKIIEDVYQAIYNCSTCPDRDDFLGSRVISFSKGSVVVASELFFRHSDNTSSSEFASRVEDSLTNANKSILQDLNVTDVKAEVSPPTPPPTESPTGTKDTSLTHSPSGLTTTPNPSEITPTPTQVSENSPTSTLSTPEQFTTTENASLTSSPPGPNSNETSEEPPKIPTPTPELAPVWISLSFRIINRNFTDELSNPDSEEFKNLSKTIGDVYEAIYNCSGCPYHGDFLGYRGISFSKGSIVVNSTLLYQATDLTTAAEFPTRVETSLTNASKEMRKDLEVTDVKAFNLGLLTPTTASTTKPTPRTDNTSLTASPSNLTDAPNPSEDTATPTQTSVSTEDHTPTESPSPSEDTSPTSSPSPSSPSSPTKTTKASTATPAITRVSLTYRITSMNFSEELSKPNSQAFDNLRKIIGEMYKDVYNSPSFKDVYLGYSIVSFSRGSVKVDSELQFRKNDRTSSPKFASQVETGLKDADKESHQGMELADIKATTVSSTSVPVTTKPDGSHGSDSSSSHGVPGWGIALLVLVSILLFLALLYSVYLIIRWCRRQSRGSMDLISTRDSYHPMNEYPTYETHGRYAAPGSKANPYNETLPRNGTSGFSYTNPVMANNNL